MSSLLILTVALLTSGINLASFALIDIYQHQPFQWGTNWFLAVLTFLLVFVLGHVVR